jgi:cell wall-associated NlpC family hydrolase
MPIKPGYLALAGAGAIVAYAGIKGYGISGSLRDILSGNKPTGQNQINPITPASYPVSGLVGGAQTTGPGSSNIANLALEYIGFKYVWGGAPANGGTDCSGWVNMIVGWFAKQAIPGYAAGTYDGSTHGPATVQWLAWNGCYRVPGGIQNAEPGDLAVWQTHMGIIVQGGQTTEQAMMVSDLNPSLGTQETTVAGAAPPGEILFIERLKA